MGKVPLRSGPATSPRAFRVTSPAGLRWFGFNFWLHWARFYIPDDSKSCCGPKSPAIQLVVSPANSLKPSKEAEKKDKTHKKIELLLGVHNLAVGKCSRIDLKKKKCMLVNFYVENVSCEFYGHAALDHGVPTTHFANLGESKTWILEVITNKGATGPARAPWLLTPCFHLPCNISWPFFLF